MSITHTTGRLYTAAAPTQARDTSDTSDAALIRSIAAGNKDAMRILFTRHRVRIYRFVLRFVADGSTAEDLVSEVFLDVWRQARDFRGRSQVGTWLLAIARNKALSTLRRPPTQALDDDAAVIEEPANNPELTMQNRQRSEIVRKCVTKLSPAHREIIDLVYYHEKSINEAADIIGVPQNTVKTRMFYARKQIADLMAAHGISPEIV